MVLQQNSKATTDTRTLHALTGLRFVAALAVFVHHVSGHFGIDKVRGSLGALAVSFFFVLSGFILTYVYDGRLQRNGIRRFYFSRWVRIWPLHITCFLISLIGFGVGGLEGQFLFPKLVAAGLLLQSWVPDAGWIFAVNGVAWSISTEMFFYLAFPLFLLGGRKRFWGKFATLLAGMALLTVGLSRISHSGILPTDVFVRLAHCNPLLRLPEFCTGMATGFVFLHNQPLSNNRRKRSRWLDTLGEVIAVGSVVGFAWLIQSSGLVGVVQRAPWGGPFLSSLVRFTSGCTVFAGVIYLFASSRGVIAKFLGTPAMVFLGEVSFAFYMCHSLVIRFVTQYARFYEGIPPMVVGISVGVLALIVSVVLFKLVEVPSKSAGLALYDRDYSRAWPAFSRATVSFSRSRLAQVCGLLFVVFIGILATHPQREVLPVAWQAIIRNTEPRYRRVDFDKRIKLRGFSVTPVQSGLDITMIWQKWGTFEGYRVIQLRDEHGRVAATSTGGPRRFAAAPVGATFADRVLIPRQAIEKTDQIGVCFEAKGQDLLKVTKGPTSMSRRCLDLVSSNQLSQIVLAYQAPDRQRLATSDDARIHR